MSRTLLLSKNGDICGILPCLQAEFRETGKRPTLIVAKEYSGWVKTIPWLIVEEYDGSHEFIGSALRWAKARGKVDFLPEVHGSNGYPPPIRKHPSFQYDQWDRMGRLHQWGVLPLDLPRRLNDPVIPLKGPTILVGDHSQSSPFAGIDDLVTALQQTFPLHHVMRLSSIRMPLLTDFLALYDAADLIVSIDTAHAHLSMASKTPFIMLAQDSPSIWHGSAFHPRMKLHVRYSDYALRKGEILWTAKKSIALKT